MNTHDDPARPIPGAGPTPASDDAAVERQIKQHQAEFLGDRTTAYYIKLAEKLKVLIDELEARPFDEQPAVMLDRLRNLFAELQDNIKSMEKNPD